MPACLKKSITEPSWLLRLANQFNQPYFGELEQFLQKRSNAGARIFPSNNRYFRALNLCAFEDVKVVIIGQDPYHAPHQADGLSFSVSEKTLLPPSLKNIFKELSSDLNLTTVPTSGDLSPWARQGVLLLNSILSVEEGAPGSHRGQGWEIFTQNILERLNAEGRHLVFILWGAFAQKLAKNIDPKKHMLLQSAHPSPLSAYRGFFGSKPFSTCNKFLTSHNLKPILWA